MRPDLDGEASLVPPVASRAIGVELGREEADDHAALAPDHRPHEDETERDQQGEPNHHTTTTHQLN